MYKSAQNRQLQRHMICPVDDPILRRAEKHGSVHRNVADNLRCSPGCCALLQVGSGKSSLLAALLGELQPLESSLLPLQQPGTAPRGPVMKGTVAYCCQVPWVDAGTIRVSQGKN